MSKDINLFEQASRLKLRFESSRGLLTVEELWVIPLTGQTGSLDAIAVALNDAVQNSGNKSFVKKVSTTDQELALKFEIVKYIIDVRVTEQEQAVEKAQKASQRRLLREAIANKENEALLNADVDTLKKRLAELDE